MQKSIKKWHDTASIIRTHVEPYNLMPWYWVIRLLDHDKTNWDYTKKHRTSLVLFLHAIQEYIWC